MLFIKYYKKSFLKYNKKINTNTSIKNPVNGEIQVTGLEGNTDGFIFKCISYLPITCLNGNFFLNVIILLPKSLLKKKGSFGMENASN
jgi:hypothetical protein